MDYIRLRSNQLMKINIICCLCSLAVYFITVGTGLANNNPIIIICLDNGTCLYLGMRIVTTLLLIDILQILTLLCNLPMYAMFIRIFWLGGRYNIHIRSIPTKIRSISKHIIYIPSL
ncbi:hypothetical protein ACJX0J_019057 [Zea mays]